MLKPADRSADASNDFWQERFLEMLPSIRRHAAYAFRRLDPEARDDAVEEIVANAYVAFARLVQRGKANVAYPGALARYAVAQFHAGRRVGTRWNTRDVFSVIAQRKHSFRVERLGGADSEGSWRDAVLEDNRTPVADQAAFRCDFPEWLKTLSTRDREVAEALMRGEKAGHVAQLFSLCKGRVSQLRREFHDSWDRFHGLDVAPASA